MTAPRKGRANRRRSELPKGAYRVPGGGYVQPGRASIGPGKITVTAVHREQPDLRLLAMAIIDIIEAEHAGKRRRKSGP